MIFWPGSLNNLLKNKGNYIATEEPSFIEERETVHLNSNLRENHFTYDSRCGKQLLHGEDQTENWNYI